MNNKNNFLYCKHSNCKTCDFWKINKLYYKTYIFASFHCYICHYVSFEEQSNYHYNIISYSNKEYLLCFKCIEYINFFKKSELNKNIIFIIIKYLNHNYYNI